MNSEKDQPESGASPFRYRSGVASLLGLNVSDGRGMPPASIQRQAGLRYGSEELTERPYLRGHSQYGEKAEPLDGSEDISTGHGNAAFETLRSAGRGEGSCGLKNDVSPEATAVYESSKAGHESNDASPETIAVYEFSKAGHGSNDALSEATPVYESSKAGHESFSIGLSGATDKRDAGAAKPLRTTERGSYGNAEMDSAQKEAIMDVEVQGRQTRLRYKVKKSPQEILRGDFIGRAMSETPDELSAGNFKTMNPFGEKHSPEAGRSGAVEGFLSSSPNSRQSPPEMLPLKSGGAKESRPVFSKAPGRVKNILTPEIEKLRRALRELSARSSREQANMNNNKQEERRNDIQPPAALPEVVVRRVPHKTGTPCAFWERSSLGRFNLKTLR